MFNLSKGEHSRPHLWIEGRWVPEPPCEGTAVAELWPALGHKHCIAPLQRAGKWGNVFRRGFSEEDQKDYGASRRGVEGSTQRGLQGLGRGR